MIDSIIQLFGDYTFQVVAIGAISLGVLSGVTGTFAVLRKQSLLGDSIAHASLAGIAFSFIVTNSKNTEVLLLGALVVGLIATGIINGVSKVSRINFESSMALVMSTFFGLGLILLTLIQKQPNSNQAGLERFLFGQAATILKRDVYFTFGVTLLVLLLMVLLWKELKMYAFDPVYTQATGLPVGFLNTVLSGFIVVSVIMGIQMVGVVLMSALIVTPAVAARQWTHSLKGMVVLAAIFGAISGLSGTLISSSVAKFPAGPAIVVIASIIVMISLLFAPGRGIINKLIRRAHAKRDFEADMAIIHLLTHQILDMSAEFTQEQLRDACIIDHYRDPHSFEALFRNLLQRNIIRPTDTDTYRLTESAKLEYSENRGEAL